MNQRIRDLAEQAGWDRFWALDERNEKFVELIVQECIDVAKQQHNPAALNYKPSERFVEALQQHFGVEE